MFQYDSLTGLTFICRMISVSYGASWCSSLYNFLLLPRTDYNTGSSWGNSLNIPSTLCVFAL
uniref:Uncharacterized protein n=1 Tax=Anguilla anguilla TaxID=7936 RepID=A0A0E9SB64_ANGAN